MPLIGASCCRQSPECRGFAYTAKTIHAEAVGPEGFFQRKGFGAMEGAPDIPTASAAQLEN